MERFLTRGWETIVPGCGGTAALTRGSTLAARSMSPSQSAITQWSWGFHTLRSVIDPGDLRFRPQVVGVVEIWKDF